MPPSFALLIWFLCLVALLIWDPAKSRKVSIALWLPVVWLFFAGSRLPSQWLNQGSSISAAAIEEGDPFNRSISFGLILLAIVVLLARSVKWRELLVRNSALVLYILFALISACWSDFPLVALKRWFRDFGGYLIVLVVLTDPDPVEAIRIVLRRTCYLLIPLSILLDKYFPILSRIFDPWTGAGQFAGVTTGKNLLGCIAMISGLFFVWDSVVRWPERRQMRTKWILIVDAAFVAMSLELLRVASSATCLVCFGLGCLAILAGSSKFFKRHRTLLKASAPAIFLLYVLLSVGLGMSGTLARYIGKDPTLTGRTEIWSFLLSMHTNPVIGTGYESFWMGPRLDYFWQNAGLGQINEAHNGFLEVYLQLGVIGLLLIVWISLSSYANICRRLDSQESLASLGLSMWLVTLFFSVTEAAFRMGVLWAVFLMLGVTVPMHGKKRNVRPEFQKKWNGRPDHVDDAECSVTSYWGAASRISAGHKML